jgi:addiction module RelE/StbE family toxin
MRITTTRNFDKQFKKQPVKVQKAFAKRIELFLVDLNNPILNSHKLSGKLKDLWSFNVTGDIWVVFDRSFDDVIVLEAIGTHSELYS